MLQWFWSPPLVAHHQLPTTGTVDLDERSGYRVATALLASLGRLSALAAVTSSSSS